MTGNILAQLTAVAGRSRAPPGDALVSAELLVALNAAHVDVKLHPESADDSPVLTATTGNLPRPRIGSQVGDIALVDAVTVAVFATIAGLAVTPVRDPDVFWHLATGRLIVRTHHIPRADPFSWTAPGRRWIAHEWLTEVLFHGAHTAFGWAGLILLSASAIVVAFLFAWSAAVRLGAPKWAATTVTGIAALGSLHTWGARPQMFSLALTGLLGRLMVDAWQGRERRLWWAVPLVLIWANLHGGYIFAIALLGAFAVGATIDRVFASRRTGPGTHATPNLERNAWIVTALAAAASLVNPNGLRGFLYPFSYLGDNASTRYVGEWFAPKFSNPQYWPFALLLVLVFGALVRNRRDVPTYQLIGALAFAFLGLQSVRNIGQFGILAVAVIAVGLGRRAAGTTEGTDVVRTPHTITHGALAVAAVAAWAVMSGPNLSANANVMRQSKDFPIASVVWIRAHTQPSQRIFNDYAWGGYLTLFAPDVPVFVDGRPDMYGDAFMDRFISTWRLRNGWEQRLRADGVTRVLARGDAPIAKALAATPGWTVVHHDDLAVVIDRNT